MLILGDLHSLINPHTGKVTFFLNISYALVQTLDINAEALSLCMMSNQTHNELIFCFSVAELFYRHFC